MKVLGLIKASSASQDSSMTAEGVRARANSVRDTGSVTSS